MAPTFLDKVEAIRSALGIERVSPPAVVQLATRMMGVTFKEGWALPDAVEALLLTIGIATSEGAAQPAVAASADASAAASPAASAATKAAGKRKAEDPLTTRRDSKQ
jgi:hypothetical protein